MKILSMYLPQFHRVKENDEWWGEGYTDWVSARDAMPLYKGHYQPHIPQNQYYYDLMEKSALEWQAALMKKYGIDGQCIYHYWFKDGKQLLEKPAENLLKWRDIDMPFCFSWANQSWANSWSALKGVNIWCDARENKKKCDNDDGLLVEQQYGDEKEWKEHFDYLLPFFRDERYIKTENKPVFVLYQAGQITVLNAMSECWNRWAREEGFEGIYFVGTNSGRTTSLDVALYPGPQTVMNDLLSKLPKSSLRCVDYQSVWDGLITKAYIERECMVGAFVGYDDTPRRGSRGCVIEHASPEIFKENFTKLLAIQANHNQPFVFVNAWNEWGEGMHLEPDEKNGTAYLEAVRYCKSHYGEYMPEAKRIEESCYEKLGKEIVGYKGKIARYESYWRIMDKWLLLKEQKKSLSNILEEKGCYKVALYGVGMLGKHLICDLSGSNVKIVCAIDKNSVEGQFDFPIIDLNGQIPVADAVIVTPVYEFEKIRIQLNEKGIKHVISIESLFE